MLMKIIEKCPQCSRGCIMSNLPIFSHPSFGTVRIVERNDEPWFVAKALGYRIHEEARCPDDGLFEKRARHSMGTGL